jgi:hypothetical protein
MRLRLLKITKTPFMGKNRLRRSKMLNPTQLKEEEETSKTKERKTTKSPVLSLR